MYLINTRRRVSVNNPVPSHLWGKTVEPAQNPTPCGESLFIFTLLPSDGGVICVCYFDCVSTKIILCAVNIENCVWEKFCSPLLPFICDHIDFRIC
jgi:hypothetical protein